jgi:hypothetical protein
MLSVYFLAPALFVLYVRLLLNAFTGLSFFLPPLLFGHELSLLIFIQPRDRLDVNFALSEGSKAFAEYLLDSRYSKEKKRIGYHPYINVFELKDVFEVMLLVGSDVGDERPFPFLDIIAIACVYFMHPFVDKLE